MKKKPLPLNKILNLLIVCLVFSSIYFENKVVSVYTSSKTPVSIISSGSKETKSIALTFDDGPHPIYTVQILDILKEYNIQATFFVLGIHAEKYPDVIKRQNEEGHEIGNHSYSHINMRKTSISTIQKEFEKTQNIVYSITNKKPNLFRPPYGIYNNDVTNVISSNNSSIVLWTFYQDSKDWSNPGVNIIADTTLNKISNGDIILFHDYIYKSESNTVDALKIIIPKLIQEGYKFVTISELMNLVPGEETVDVYN